jgi:NitT/TauT family transport system permease protein
MDNKMISKDRQIYLKKIKNNRVVVLTSQILLLVIFIALWEILAKTSIINSFITSSPSRIINTFKNIKNNGLMLHLWVTTYETIIGFLSGTIIGIIIAIILWWSKFLAKVLEPFLVVLSALPKTALGPIIIIWVGAGTPAIIVMAIAISLVVTILDISNGFLNTDTEKIIMAKSFNATKFQLLTKIVIPSNISTFINTLKVNIGLSLVGVITGEFLVSKAGLGYLIVYGGQVFQLDLVMTSVIILGILAAIMYESVVILEKIILKEKTKN